MKHPLYRLFTNNFIIVYNDVNNNIVRLNYNYALSSSTHRTRRQRSPERS